MRLSALSAAAREAWAEAWRHVRQERADGLCRWRGKLDTRASDCLTARTEAADHAEDLAFGRRRPRDRAFGTVLRALRARGLSTKEAADVLRPGGNEGWRLGLARLRAMRSAS